MPLWKKLWLLFAVIWLFVGLLHVATILALADVAERSKLWTPFLFTLVVPPLVYGLAWVVARLRRRGGHED
jgi:ABC-type molybdate transport system permease subunit